LASFLCLPDDLALTLDASFAFGYVPISLDQVLAFIHRPDAQRETISIARRSGAKVRALSFSGSDDGKAMFAEPTFIASMNGLCGFILVVEDGEVDAFTPSGEWLGVYHERVEAAEAVIRHDADA
jgi:hypothetical protein